MSLAGTTETAQHKNLKFLLVSFIFLQMALYLLSINSTADGILLVSVISLELT
jgi:hypothetical protein